MSVVKIDGTAGSKLVVDAQKLQAAREVLGYRQCSAALALGWSRTRYNNYERGVSQPSVTNLRKIADLFGVKMDDLLCDQT